VRLGRRSTLRELLALERDLDRAECELEELEDLELEDQLEMWADRELRREVVREVTSNLARKYSK